VGSSWKRQTYDPADETNRTWSNCDNLEIHLRVSLMRNMRFNHGQNLARH